MLSALKIEGMSYASCVAKVEKTLKGITGVQQKATCCAGIGSAFST